MLCLHLAGAALSTLCIIYKGDSSSNVHVVFSWLVPIVGC